jgi:thiamine pyrophosphate-dependent acetolactate synthase large subunit-like protein
MTEVSCVWPVSWSAVQLKCNLVHLVWIDGAYDMVRFQKMSKYGRDSGVDFGRARIKRLGTARPSKCRGFDTVE